MILTQNHSTNSFLEKNNGLESLRLEKKITREFAEKVSKNLPFHDEIKRLRPMHKLTEEKFKWCE